MIKPVIIGIAGGSGSGKTTVTKAIIKEFKNDLVIIPQDAYYQLYDKIPTVKKGIKNFDHPAAIDNALLIKQIMTLKQGTAVEMPVYDFKTHKRQEETVPISPKPIIIVEGILIFENEELRNQMDIKIFVDTDSDIRILRRIKRDMIERGRTLESIIQQYEDTVRPMHVEFVEPSKRYADIILPEGGYNKIGIHMIISQIKYIITKMGVI